MRYSVQNSKLPLAVYREVAAHLTQVDSVQADLIPQTSPHFEYTLSQVGRLDIQISDPANSESIAQVDRILAYYGDRFGNWTVLSGVETR